MFRFFCGLSFYYNWFPLETIHLEGNNKELKFGAYFKEFYPFGWMIILEL